MIFKILALTFWHGGGCPARAKLQGNFFLFFFILLLTFSLSLLYYGHRK